MTLYSMDFNKGKFVSAKDTGIDVQPDTLYYHGSYVMPSVVYVTRILGDNVCYVYVIDRWRFDMTGYEHFDSINSFKLSVYTANNNVSNQIKDLNFNDYYALEANRVWSNELVDFDIPQDYETHEAHSSRLRIEAKARQEREAKIIRYDTVEVAKIVRRKLKEKFPGTKFSVRSDRYSMGSSIDVTWIDGPTTEQVKEIVGGYHGATFDGMEDLKNYHVSVDPDTGNEVRWGNDYIDFSRNYTPNAIEQVWQELGQKYDLENAQLEIVDRDYKPGTAYFKINNDFVLFRGGRDTVQDELRIALQNRSFVDAAPRDTVQHMQETPEESDSGVQYGEYKGHATITLPYGSKGFSFGVNKAKTILEYLEEIQKFVEDNTDE